MSKTVSSQLVRCHKLLSTTVTNEVFLRSTNSETSPSSYIFDLSRLWPFKLHDQSIIHKTEPVPTTHAAAESSSRGYMQSGRKASTTRTANQNYPPQIYNCRKRPFTYTFLVSNVLVGRLLASRPVSSRPEL